MKAHSEFCQLIQHGFLGSLAGFLNGLLFGAIIGGISAVFAANTFPIPDALTLGAAFGTVIGGVAGLLFIIRRVK